jgi:hypothetical protein
MPTDDAAAWLMQETILHQSRPCSMDQAMAHRYWRRELPSVFKVKISDGGLKQEKRTKYQYYAISPVAFEAKHSIFED